MKVQNYRNSVLFNSYEEAIAHIENTLVNDPSIVDGQEIFARYKNNEKVETIVAAAYKDEDGNVSFSIVNNNEGMSIIASHDEPSEFYRDNYLWLQETDDVIVNDKNEITNDIRSMQNAITELMKIVQRHEYAFNNVMDCGTVSNNLREEMMNEATPEAPLGYEDGTESFLLYTYEEGVAISDITNYYLRSSESSNISINNGEWSDIIPSLEENTFLWAYREILLDNDNLIKTQPYKVAQYSATKVIDTIDAYYAVGEDETMPPSKTSGQYQKTIPLLNTDQPYLFNYLECVYIVDDSENKPNYSQASTPNVKHLIIKSANTELEIKENLKNILNNELIWCEGNNGLYIKTKGKLVKINGGSIGSDITDENINEIMSGITSSSGCISTIQFITTKGNKYTMKVDEEKGLMVYNSQQDALCPEPSGGASGTFGSTVGALNAVWQKLYINSVYCGGEVDSNGNPINEHSLNPCSHNFVELSNLTDNDINLNGMSLQYAASGGFWKVLPLWGVIKAKSTFLIRGAQCSIMDVNTTVIKVKDYDMIWIDTATNEPIKFSNQTAKFYLTYGTERCPSIQPYSAQTVNDKKIVQVMYGYIDLVGFQDKTHAVDAYEDTAYKNFLSSKNLLRKYYAMDSVTQATKALDKRKNTSDWYYVDLTRSDILPNIEVYTPKSSKQKKNLFYDKTRLLENKPTTVSISFGIQATDNGSGATRCFNWVSKGCYDEFLYYRIKNSMSGWTVVESYKGNEDKELVTKNGGSHGYYTKAIGKYYNRIIQEATNGDVFTAHKVVLRGLSAGIYEYSCGKYDGSDTPNFDVCSDIKEFTIRTDENVNKNGYTFIHVSDQQGFNWDEYEVWRYSADYINEFNKKGDANDKSGVYKEKAMNAQFTINTGDMTQNGNRMNEWLDYFNGRESISYMEEMATIGNNDLSPKILYELASVDDTAKVNPANINFYYTFEIDEEYDGNGEQIYAPIFADGEKEIGYIPSIYSFNYGDTHFICVNSEIGATTEELIYGMENTGVIYGKIKEWCENDIAKHSGKHWYIAYCHEMPFTIIIDSLMSDYYSGETVSDSVERHTIKRGGSRINTNTTNDNAYWFSKFCQANGVRLVMGGHKHTQAITYPLIENERDSMKPIIQVTQDILNNDFNGSTHLVVINDESQLNGYSYPSSWFDVSGVTSATCEDIKSDYGVRAHFCAFEVVDSITAPIYSMSQATGYKHTSNKELPAKDIPWQHYYYPNVNGGVNTAQRQPFFTVVNVTQDNIILNVRCVENVLVGGKFNVNEQGLDLKNGTKTVTTSNGLSADERNKNTHIIITH